MAHIGVPQVLVGSKSGEIIVDIYIFKIFSEGRHAVQLQIILTQQEH